MRIFKQQSKAARTLKVFIKTARYGASPTGRTLVRVDPEHVAAFEDLTSLDSEQHLALIDLVFDEIERCLHHRASNYDPRSVRIPQEQVEHEYAWHYRRVDTLPEHDPLVELAGKLLQTCEMIGEARAKRLIRICFLEPHPGTYELPFLTTLVEVLAREFRVLDENSELGKHVAALRIALLNRPYIGENNIKLSIDLQRMFIETSGLPIERGEPFADAVIAHTRTLNEQERGRWAALLEHAETASGSAPSRRWIKKASSLVSEIGSLEVGGLLAIWLPLIERPRSPDDLFMPSQPLFFLYRHTDILKGLCWIASVCAEGEVSERIARSMGLVALASYKKVPGQGMRLQKVGNAAVYALGQIPGRASLGQLAMLRIKVKYGQAQKQIEKALDAAAEREGLPRDEIEEIAVTSYGLDAVGLGTDTLGDFTAEIRVGGAKGATHAEISFVNAAGKRLKSVPAAVKKDHAEELKELKASLKDLQKMLPAQRDRLDALFVANRTWSYGAWRERYLDHPLVGVLARRMIWVFDDGKDKVAAAWLADGFTPDGDIPAHAAGRLVRADGAPFEPDGDATIVSLWHPVEADSPPGEPRVRADVEDWRRFYEDRGVRQPFKQAHREIYLLTDAEVRTEVYSNRFAAHILRQHQCHALCQQRGWKSMLRIAADTDVHPAYKVLPAFGLRAEFWAESVGDGDGDDVLPSGAYVHIATDQVRFYPIDGHVNRQHAGGGGVYRMENAAEPVRMDRIPPLAFSEIMRDVDLFVGVASVGNNPQWQDGGPEGRFLDAWQNYAFGELSGTAETRRDLLGRLLPRLKIKNACTLTDRFLVVLGKKRVYKIHLGSGNILMEPGDQYLCIVPNSAMEAGPKGKIHLPFEGDRTLAIILSKAFMLAEDDKITDKSIISQIARR